MYWKLPPVIKVYEALGAIADHRIQVNGNTAKVSSSSGNKYYEVYYDATTNAITANDNASYWQGYLGYPSIAFLLAAKHISYNPTVVNLLKDIAWKDINTKFKNNFDETEKYVRELVEERGGKLSTLDETIQEVTSRLEKMHLKKLRSTLKPPNNY